MSFKSVFGRNYEKHVGLPYFYKRVDAERLADLEDWIQSVARMHGVTFDDVMQKLCDGFFADPWVKERQYPVGALLNNPTKYYARVPPMTQEERDQKLSAIMGKINVARTDLQMAESQGDESRIAFFSEQLEKLIGQRKKLEHA